MTSPSEWTKLALLGLNLAVPDHTTLSRRGRAFAGRQPRVRASTGPVHLMLDSTGLELFGQGEWCAAKHGRRRRRWLKLHIGVDATTGEIAAHVLTDGDEDDAAQVPALLRQPDGVVASLTADGAYDRDPVYQAAAALQPGLPIEVVIPPRADAVLSTADPNQQTPRDGCDNEFRPSSADEFRPTSRWLTVWSTPKQASSAPRTDGDVGPVLT